MLPRGLFRKRRLEQELDEEVRAHLEMLVEENVGKGMSREEARYAARRSFGGVEQVKEAYRERRGLPMIETVIQDVRYGARLLAKNPGFTTVAVLTLALGIGANTAIFSVVNAVLLKPLPYEHAGRLIMLCSQNLPKGFTTDPVSAPDFADWRAQNHVFEQMAASTDATYTMTGLGEPLPVTAYQFSPDFFHVLGVQPILGRVFLPDEDLPGKNHVVVLSYRLWQSHFGRDPNIVGRAVTLDGESYSVVGVMPEDFTYPGSATELWTPLTIPADLAARRDIRYLRVLGRLRAGVDVKQAHQEMTAIAARLAREYPNTNTGEDTVRLVPLRELEVGSIEPALLTLFGAVAFVLLIACANVAGLLLTRTTGREKEIAVRLALGAGGRRIIRQFLTESTLLALLGGTAGVLFAAWTTGVLVRMFPPNIANIQIPRVERIPLDARVLGFALLTSVLTALAFGLVPGLRASRLNPHEPLKEAARSLAGSARGSRFRRGLIIAEFALSLTLLAGAGLMIKSLFHLIRVDLGFRPDHVLTLRAFLPGYKYKTDDQQRAFMAQVLGEMRALPGVESAASITFLPLSGWYGIRNFTIEGQAGQDPGQQSMWSAVTADYFRTMSIPLLKGRLFTPDDRQGTAGVAVISDALARRFWPGREPIGRFITLQYVPGAREIVGVVGSVRQFGQGVESQPEIYLAYDQAPEPLICFTTRTTLDPASVANAARRAVWAVDKDQALSYVMSMDDLVSETVAPQRVTAILFALFAGLALALATVGIYGVISYSVSQRTHEFGIRVSVGATTRDLLSLVLKEAAGLILTGLALGLLAAGAFGRVMSSMLASVHTLDPSTGVMLYGVKPLDPLTYALVSLLLVGVALVASYIPARRATKVDPMVALRYE